MYFTYEPLSPHSDKLGEGEGLIRLAHRCALSASPGRGVRRHPLYAAQMHEGHLPTELCSLVNGQTSPTGLGE